MEQYLFVLLLLVSYSTQRDISSSSQSKSTIVLRVELPRPEDVQLLQKLEKPPDCEADFWKSRGNGLTMADVTVSPKLQNEVKSALKKQKLTFTVIATNLSKIFEKDAETRRTRRVFRPGDDPGKLGMEDFHDFDEIQAYLKSVSKKYKGTTKLVELGKSTEGRPLTAIKIGRSSTTTKKVVFMNGCIHAREWLGCAAMLYIIKQLTENPGPYQSLLDKVDVYILPVANPDGYVYSWQTDRKWRKTRSGPRGRCYGVDPNRNFAFHWGESGCSQDPCRETYCGPNAMSEPEVQAMARFMQQQSSNLKAYFDVHTYGEYFTYPYAYALTYPPNIDELKRVASSATVAINNTNHESFQWGSAAEKIYVASGSTIDYATGLIKVPLSFAMELRPTRDVLFGYIIPPQQIVPGASEAWSGIYDVLKYIIR